jgi:hypothetical protein
VAEHGGYRKPNNPAPVSGPGALSQRTDGGPATQPQMIASGNGYGERAAMQSIQGGAPMQGSEPMPRPTELGAPTGNPQDPITSGADAGPGLSPQGAGIQSDTEVSNEQLRPFLRSLELIANLPGSNAETRSWVRNLKARLGQ